MVVKQRLAGALRRRRVLLLLPGVEQTAFATVLGDIQRRLRTVSTYRAARAASMSPSAWAASWRSRDDRPGGAAGGIRLMYPS